MEPQSFRGKVFFNIIDKLVIGVIAGLVVMLFNNQNDRYLRLRDASVAIATQNINFLSNTRDQIMKYTDEYISSLEMIVYENRIVATRLSDLLRITREINGKITNLKAVINTQDPEFLKALQDKINEINTDLKEYMGREGVNNIVKNHLRDLRETYRSFLEQYSHFSLNILKRDFKKVL